MQSTEFQHRYAGGASLARRWLPADKTALRGTVQLVHGMAEHSGRYARLAGALNKAGYAVYAHDLPGHGPQSDPDDVGHFGDRRGWRIAVSSIRELQRTIQREQPGKPLFVVGHSMGSYLVQHFVVDAGGQVSGAVFSATSGDLGLTRRVGLALVRVEAAAYGKRHPSAVGEAISFKTFNRRFRPARTPFDWLSRDKAEVDRYVADPHCGYRVTTGLWIDLLEAAGWLAAPHRLRRVPKSLPVLIIAGEADPAGGGERGARSLARNYQEVGLRDVTVKVYPEARHELFNDTCREQVTRELIGWLDARAAASA
ncbi:MAG TPA: alpha/beta hydrolase [Verrucomicrobiae bacterium]|nr:alpha/beta hydrolase [Verrucomicrobiae bacterium]